MKTKLTTMLLAVAMLPALGHAQIPTVNLCDRTPLVRDQILRMLGVTERFADQCGTVSSAKMRGITELSVGNVSTSFGGPLTTLQAGDFANLPSLSTLNLEDNRLATLPEGLFDGLPNLYGLNLNNNQLTALPEDLFDGLTSLQSLSLGGNRLTALPEDLFDGLTSLRSLELSSNRLTALPEDLFDGLTSLRHLGMSNNQLCSLPTGIFGGLTSLQHLDLQDNHLVRLMDGFGWSAETGWPKYPTIALFRNHPLFEELTSATEILLGSFQTEPTGVCASDGDDGGDGDGSDGGDGDGSDGDGGDGDDGSDGGDDGGDGDGSDGDDGSDGGATSPTHPHPYAATDHTHDDLPTTGVNDNRYARTFHYHDKRYALLSHTHAPKPKRSAARLLLACGERCEAMADQPNIADLIEDAFWLEQAQCSTPRTRNIAANSCPNSAVGRRGLTYCGGGEGNLNSLMTNPPSGVGGKEITISEGVKASVAATLALQIAEMGMTCEQAAMVLYRGQFHLDTCQARADYGRMAQAIAKATGWDGLGVTLPTLATIARNRKCGGALTAAQ